MSASAPSSPWLRRPLGRAGLVALTLILLCIPAAMFHVALFDYRLHSDDFEYLSASRTPARAFENLFRPHNTHVVPSWRILTAALMQAAGTLPRLQATLAVAAYGALNLLMLLVGLLVYRETGRPALGLAALVAAGTTSVLFSSGTWYSSGQTVWASLGIVAMLLMLQSWRLHPHAWKLLAAALCAAIAGGFWTIGHAAGPVGLLYLWAHGHRRAAIVPLLATLAAVALAWSLGGRQINARISFHGRTEAEAASPFAGLTHTLQAIPEQLLAENLGLEPETSLLQGAALSAAIALLWLASFSQGRPYPLELAGAALALLAYFVEWTFRGYLPFSSLRGVVPWYDTIPHLGLVLFAFGWISRVRRPAPRPFDRGSALSLLVIASGLAIVHHPRIDSLLIAGVPRPDDDEPPLPPTREFQLARARYLWSEYHRIQRLDLARLDRAQTIARRQGIGRDAISRVFGRVDLLELPPVYDAVGLLDLPAIGREEDDSRIRAALTDALRPASPPRLILPTINPAAARPATP